MTDRFRAAGVAHILAVSGLHLTVIAWLIFAVARRLWGLWPRLAAAVSPRVAAAWVTAPAAIGYTFATGARVSTLRALLVVLVVLAAIAVGRRARIIDALGFAALLLLLLEPATLHEPSFQLSFVAAATLVVAMGSRRHASSAARRGAIWRATVGRGRQLFAASIWAAAATAPFTALAFGEVATGGVVANLVVVPVAELLVLPLGLAGGGLSLVWQGGGGALLDLAVAAASVTDRVAGGVAEWAPVLRVPPPNNLELAAAAVLWTAAVCWRRRWWRPSAAAMVAGLAVATLVGSWLVTYQLAPQARRDLKITFIDVGDGDATLIELPGGGVWLIDAGGAAPVGPPPATAAGRARQRRRSEAAGEHAVARLLDHRRIRRLDLVILSHPHPDHYQGLAAVARRVEIGQLWVIEESAEQLPPPSYQALLLQLAFQGVEVVRPPLGTVAIQRGVSLTLLHPSPGGGTITADPVMSANDNSMVARIDFAGRRLLLTGDIEVEGEEMLVQEQPAAIDVDLLKVPHHGSASSSTPGFVTATSPKWAVISCGDRFGFPNPAVVRRWRAGGAAVLTTGEVGTVTVTISPRGGIAVSSLDSAPPGDR